jgi:hypothetical protein
MGLWLQILTLYTVTILLTRALFLMSGGEPPRARRKRRRPRTCTSLEATAPRRAIEVIAADLRRREARYHHAPRGTSYAKLEGMRYAYDHVLAEACGCLEIEHLLTVLPPGPELDAERLRVEAALWLGGLRFEDAA